MIDLGIIIFVSWVVAYADFKITKSNMSVVFNGLGSIPNVLNGEADKPMQYRVLVAWLCKLFDGHKQDSMEYVKTYLRIRHFFIFLSMFSCWFWFNVSLINPLLGITLMGLFYVFMALYDYTDIYIEVFLFSFAFTIMTIRPEWGWLLLLVIGFIGGFNRETTIFIPITMLFIGYPLFEIMVVGFFVVWGIITPIVVYGKRDRYCSLFMIRENCRRMLLLFKSKPPMLLNDYAKFLGLLLVILYLYINTFSTIGLSPIETAMGLFFILMLIPSIWYEIRVFAPVVLVIIPMALRGL